MQYLMGGFLPLGKYISTTPCSTRSAGRCWQDRSQPRPGRGLPSRTWAWSRAIGGGWPVRVVDQGGSAQDHDLGGGSSGPGHGTPQAFNSAADLPRARLGRRQRSIGPGRAVDQGGSARDVGLGGGSVEDLGPHVARTPYMSRCSFLRSCDHSARGNLSLSAVVARLDVSYM